MAHRPDPFARTRRIGWYVLIGVLCLLIFIAWTSVPEPDLMRGIL